MDTHNKMKLVYWAIMGPFLFWYALRWGWQFAIAPGAFLYGVYALGFGWEDRRRHKAAKRAEQAALLVPRQEHGAQDEGSRQ